MEGYLNLRVNPWLRRVITRLIAILPAVLTIMLSGDSNITELLILSQVVLSLQLSFAIIPLLHAVSNKDKMKEFAIGKTMLIIGILITSIILFLNIKMVVGKVMEFLSSGHGFFLNACIILVLLGLVVLLFYTLFYPLRKKSTPTLTRSIHSVHLPDVRKLNPLQVVGLALDFSKVDAVVLANAIRAAETRTKLVLIHVVESAGARVLGDVAADRETEEDRVRLEHYREYLNQQGFTHVEIALGFQNRVQEILRVCHEYKTDMLIMGAHGHSGLKDFVYGHTIDLVRHQLKIPVLIVQE
jgi:manganese transport protein